MAIYIYIYISFDISLFMKTLFIEAQRKNLRLEENIKKFILSLEKISILYSIQYKKLAEDFKKEAQSQGKKIILFQQVLGCSNPKISQSTIVLIGSGRFHAINIASRINSPIYIVEENKISQISKEEIDKLNLRKKSALSRFFLADKIGILISTKKGQYNLGKAIKLKEKFKEKKIYLFLADSISLQELENFEIDSWVNTACPGLSFDSSKIINCGDLTNF